MSLFGAYFDFTLLTGCKSHILQPYLRDLIMTLLNRLQTSRTDKYTIGLVHWICYVASLESGGYDPNIIPTVIDAIQPKYEAFIITYHQKISTKSKLQLQPLVVDIEKRSTTSTSQSST